MTPTQVDRMLEAARDITATADAFERINKSPLAHLFFEPYPLDPLTVQWARDILAANRGAKIAPEPDANPDW